MTKMRNVLLGAMIASISSIGYAKVIETTSLVGFGEAKYPNNFTHFDYVNPCLLYTSPSPRDTDKSRMPSSA